jgi:hypothetical protein
MSPHPLDRPQRAHAYSHPRKPHPMSPQLALTLIAILTVATLILGDPQ